jgi:hypothetical protein
MTGKEEVRAPQPSVMRGRVQARQIRAQKASAALLFLASDGQPQYFMDGFARSRKYARGLAAG